MNDVSADSKLISSSNDKSVNFLYGSVFGRVLQNTMLFCRVPAILGAILRSPVSRIYVNHFIKKNHIDMTGFEGVKFKSFNDFFTRKKTIQFDDNAKHLISPCDGCLSVYKIDSESTFHIKGFDYTVADLFGMDIARQSQLGANTNSTSNEQTVTEKDFNPFNPCAEFSGGMCLVFRLRPIDYHRYCYIDSGKIGENHFIKGTLHSVQDAATSRYKVYTKNRRSWTIMETENFGKVAQIEVGAFSVGGIVNHHKNCEIKKGDEKGYFDLHGSTIVMLFQKDVIELNSNILESCAGGAEVGVSIGKIIGFTRR